MNRFKYLIASLLAMVVISLTGCSDDTPAPKHNNLVEFGEEKFWLKQKLTYLYEPVSELILRQDEEGLLQVDKVISNTSTELTLCWVATPLTEETDEDAKFEIIQIFFNKDLEPDPANYRTYTRITPAQLKTGLGDIEVIEAY